MERNKIDPRCSCGKPVSRKGRLCKDCGFFNAKFKEKSCISCGITFTPKSGVQKYCNKCRDTCPICGNKKPVNSINCSNCSFKLLRKFKRVCKKCGCKFLDSNNRTILCDSCSKLESKGVCVDCGKKITPNHKRCNSCSAYNRKPNELTKGWKKYNYNGCLYRSKWEIAFAKILTECNIEFEYEVFDNTTKSRPDFYIAKINRYIEIHPDYHGKKKNIPDNCVLVKTLSHSRAIALTLVFKLNENMAKEYINKMSDQALKGIYRIALDLAVYLRQAIFERDNK